MIHTQAFDFMQRDQHTGQKEFVFLFERQSEAVDDGSQDFQQFRDSVEPFSLVNELKEDIIDRSANVGAQVQELSVDSVKCRFQEISLPGIFRVKELQKLYRSDEMA